MIEATYRHTSLVVRDVKKISDFYHKVFGSVSETPYKIGGKWFEDASKLSNVDCDVMMIPLPGHGKSGPVMELLKFSEASGPQSTPELASNRFGYGHLAFDVKDIQAAYNAVIEAGGKAYGEVTTKVFKNGVKVSIAFMLDPEGNVIEFDQISNQ